MRQSFKKPPIVNLCKVVYYDPLGGAKHRNLTKVIYK